MPPQPMIAMPRLFMLTVSEYGEAHGEDKTWLGARAKKEHRNTITTNAARRHKWVRGIIPFLAHVNSKSVDQDFGLIWIVPPNRSSVQKGRSASRPRLAARPQAPAPVHPCGRPLGFVVAASRGRLAPQDF